MSYAAVEVLRQRIRSIRSDLAAAMSQLERDFQAKLAIDPGMAAGNGRLLALEAHARKYAIDPLLVALGWNVDSPETIVVEDPVDPSMVKPEDAATRRFLDYHGRHSETGKSLLIVEAKRLRARLPSQGKAEINSAICATIADIHVGEQRPRHMTREWYDWVKTLIQYARLAESRSGHPPSRVAITNGEWIIVLSPVVETLFAETPDPKGVYIFEDLTDAEARAPELFALLDYHCVSGAIPPQPPSAIIDFVPPGSAAPCVFVVDLSYARYGARQPLISLSVAAWIRSSSGAWVLFAKAYDDEFLMLAHDADFRDAQFPKLRERATDLLADLRRHRTIELLDVAAFRSLYKDDLADSQDIAPATSPLVQRLRGVDERYRLVVGTTPTYLSAGREFDNCSFHYWGTCRETGDAQGPAAIVSPSSDPRSYFPSGSPYHCAHRAVHDQRKNKCLLLPFESHLCCRRCIYQAVCWPDGGGTLPCQATQER